MQTWARIARRTGTACAAAAAFSLATAGIASAHHCYKEDWADAAYARLSQGGTAWMPLSDMAFMFGIAPQDQEECGYLADVVTEQFMEEFGLDREPLIHSKAIVGGGAYHHKGKAPKPFEYLSDEQFGWLIGTLDSALRAAGCSGVPMG